jgi:hypothetical protein
MILHQVPRSDPAVAVEGPTLPVEAKRASMTCVQWRSAHRIRGTTLVVGTGGAVRSIASWDHWAHSPLFSRPPDIRQRVPVGSRVYPPARSFPSNGRALESARVDGQRLAEEGRYRSAGLRQLRPHSMSMDRPSRRLLVLALQQQVDRLSDEGRGVSVFGVGDHLPHPVPRRLIETERDDQWLSNHSLSSFEVRP